MNDLSQVFADTWFGQLEPVYVEITPVSRVMDFCMTAGVFLLCVSPVLIVLGFKVL
jgi:hypothetical protein